MLFNILSKWSIFLYLCHLLKAAPVLRSLNTFDQNSEDNVVNQACIESYEQCGGREWTGPTECCFLDNECVRDNDFYFQCVPFSSTSPPLGEGEVELTCSNIVTATGTRSGSGFARTHGKLKLGGLKGIQLVDENNIPVQLVGMSSHALLYFPSCYSAESIEFLVTNWGINMFRIALNVGEGGYEDHPEYFDKLKEFVDVCERLGVYIVIDWHVLTPGDPNHWLTGTGATKVNAKTFWQTVATLYKNKAHVLYEICNEPNGVNWPSVKSYADEIISAIRDIDTETVILVGTPNWSQDIHLAAADPVAKPYNVMYTFHFYAGTHIYLFSRLKAYAEAMPIFVSSWGTSTTSGDGGSFFRITEFFLDLLKEKQISWAQWSYSDHNETAAALLPGSCDTKEWDNTSCSGTFAKNFLKTGVGSGALNLTPQPTISSQPTRSPTTQPSHPTSSPTFSSPTIQPSQPTSSPPANSPTIQPSQPPISPPVSSPTVKPSQPISSSPVISHTTQPSAEDTVSDEGFNEKTLFMIITVALSVPILLLVLYVFHLRLSVARLSSSANKEKSLGVQFPKRPHNNNLTLEEQTDSQKGYEKPK